ncbi:RNA polymerase sigma-70 factor [Niabella terrae]
MNDQEHIDLLQHHLAVYADERAYRKLFYYFHPLLKRFSFHILGDHEVAEEMAADVLLKIWIRRDQMALIKDLKLYLFKATRNACLNYLDSRRLRNDRLTDGLCEQQQQQQCGSPESDFIYSEMHRYMQHAVEQLPEKCRLVFRLIREYGLTHEQVTAVMGISRNTTETHMRLALRKLKTALDHYRQPEK